MRSGGHSKKCSCEVLFRLSSDSDLWIDSSFTLFDAISFFLISLCHLCVLCVSVVNQAIAISNHGDTENPEAAKIRRGPQRKQTSYSTAIHSRLAGKSFFSGSMVTTYAPRAPMRRLGPKVIFGMRPVSYS